MNNGETQRVSKRAKIIVLVTLGAFGALGYWAYQETKKQQAIQQLTDSIDAWLDSPWYFLKESERRTSSGEQMYFCEEAGYSPRDVMEEFDREGIPYQVDDHLDGGEGTAITVTISFELDQGPMWLNFYRGRDWCLMSADATGHSVYDQSGYE